MIKISIKNIYLILIISIGLIVLGIGSSYAMFTASSNIDNPISLSSNLITNEDIFESFNVNLSSRESRSIKFNITNSNNISNIKYASWYIYNGDSNDISFYIDKTNDNYIDFNGELSVNGGIIAIDIINNTSNNISLTIGVSSRKNNIILPSYMKLISGDNKPEVTSTFIADYITNLYTNASKTTVENNSITYNYASSVNLMNDRLGGSTDSLDGGNIRYYGASPNNYIYFNCETYPDTNCELWRIIGIFDGKIKIMRNESIGAYSWDTMAKAASLFTKPGINEWSQADIMKLLNPGHESESVGGSLYYNSKSGTCYNGTKNATTACDFTSSGIKNDITRGKIAEVTFYTGGADSDDIAGGYSNTIYQKERGTEVISNPKDGITRLTSWNGKLALLYPSDYTYATDFNICSSTIINYDDSGNSYGCRSNDWMYPILGTSNNSWMLTPTSLFSFEALYIEPDGSVTYSTSKAPTYQPFDIVPTLYLNATETIVDGTTGSQDNPYKLNP